MRRLRDCDRYRRHAVVSKTKAAQKSGGSPTHAPGSGARLPRLYPLDQHHALFRDRVTACLFLALPEAVLDKVEMRPGRLRCGFRSRLEDRLPPTVTLAPFVVPARGHEGLAAVLAVSGLLALLTLTGDRRILRKEGALLLVLYASYTAWRTLS